MEEEGHLEDIVLLQFFREQMLNKEWADPVLHQEPHQDPHLSSVSDSPQTNQVSGPQFSEGSDNVAPRSYSSSNRGHPSCSSRSPTQLSHSSGLGLTSLISSNGLSPPSHSNSSHGLTPPSHSYSSHGLNPPSHSSSRNGLSPPSQSNSSNGLSPSPQSSNSSWSPSPLSSSTSSSSGSSSSPDTWKSLSDRIKSDGDRSQGQLIGLQHPNSHSDIFKKQKINLGNTQAPLNPFAGSSWNTFMKKSELESSQALKTGNMTEEDDSGSPPKMGKDQKLATAAGIRFKVKDMVALPMDEFNDLLAKHDMSEEQLNLCRDIRRRGKNKVAAQNCRKRKLSQLDELQIRLGEAVKVKNRLKRDHSRLFSEYKKEMGRLDRLTDRVITHYKKDPRLHIIQVVGEDIKIIPKSQTEEEGRSPNQIPELVPPEGVPLTPQVRPALSWQHRFN